MLVFHQSYLIGNPFVSKYVHNTKLGLFFYFQEIYFIRDKKCPKVVHEVHMYIKVMTPILSSNWWLQINTSVQSKTTQYHQKFASRIFLCPRLHETPSIVTLQVVYYLLYYPKNLNDCVQYLGRSFDNILEYPQTSSL